MGQVFDYAIPGQSLTQAPGAFKFEQPPQYTDENEALLWMWQALLKPEAIANIRVLLKNDISVVEMAQTLLYAGMMDGKWTVDLAFQMFQETTWMVEAIAKKSGVTDYTYKKEKPEFKKFVSEYADLLAEPDKKEEQALETVRESVFAGIA
jgi:hypothetical protein